MSFSRVVFGVIVLHFLLVISEADLQAINNDPADIKQFKNITSTLNSYKAGIGDLLSNIPDDYQDQRDDLFILSVLKGSVYDHLYWGKIKPNNTMVTFSKGHTNGCWAMIIQKDHPMLQKRGPTYNTLKSDGIVHIAINFWKLLMKIHLKEHQDIVKFSIKNFMQILNLVQKRNLI